MDDSVFIFISRASLRLQVGSLTRDPIPYDFVKICSCQFPEFNIHVTMYNTTLSFYSLISYRSEFLQKFVFLLVFHLLLQPSTQSSEIALFPGLPRSNSSTGPFSSASRICPIPSTPFFLAGQL